MKKINYLLSICLLLVIVSACVKDSSEIIQADQPQSFGEQKSKPEKNVCVEARLGLDKHGGQILFTNMGDKCYMMTAFQIFLHSAPIFDALCELDVSKLAGSLTFLVHKLFKDAFDPNRDVSKPYDASWFVKAMVEHINWEYDPKTGVRYNFNPMTGEKIRSKDYLNSGYQDAGTFLNDFLRSIARENKGNALAKAFIVSYNAGYQMSMPQLVHGGNSVAEKLSRHFTSEPANSLPAVIFPRVAHNLSADGLSESINIPVSGDFQKYSLTGAALVVSQHYTARVKNLKSGAWEKYDSLCTYPSPVDFTGMAEGYFTSFVAVQRADYQMRH